MIPTKDYLLIASDKLQGKSVTCAGCEHRAMLEITDPNHPEDTPTSIWTEFCVKNLRENAPHSHFDDIADASEQFQTICPLFNGVADPIRHHDEPVYVKTQLTGWFPPSYTVSVFVLNTPGGVVTAEHIAETVNARPPQKFSVF